MPNWLYLFTSFFYQLGLAIWIGGAIALGAFAAPELFRELPRAQAGGIFGRMLRRFGRVRVAAFAVILASAALKHAWWEGAATPWIAIRWVALAVMAAMLLYELGFLERAMEARRVHLTPEMPDSDPSRQVFQALHRRAEAVLKTATLAALVAMVFA